MVSCRHEVWSQTLAATAVVTPLCHRVPIKPCSCSSLHVDLVGFLPCCSVRKIPNSTAFTVSFQVLTAQCAQPYMFFCTSPLFLSFSALSLSPEAKEKSLSAVVLLRSLFLSYGLQGRAVRLSQGARRLATSSAAHGSRLCHALVPAVLGSVQSAALSVPLCQCKG